MENGGDDQARRFDLGHHKKGITLGAGCHHAGDYVYVATPHDGATAMTTVASSSIGSEARFAKAELCQLFTSYKSWG